MNGASTLTELLLALGESGGLIRYIQKGGRESSISCAELVHRAQGLLGRFQQQGAEAGDPLLIFVRNNMAFVDAFWACQLGGLIPVPLSAGVNSEYTHKLISTAAKFDAPFLFVERDLFQRLNTAVDADSMFAGRICLLEEVVQLDQKGVVHHPEPTATALIQFSSGSTDAPKGVVLTHENLLSNVRAITKAARISSDDVTLSWMPLTHDMGLIGFHLVPLFNRLDQVLMDSEVFVRRPARWLQAAHQQRASLLCSPNFGYQHYLKSVPEPDPELDLARVRLIFNGAEPVSASVCREFARRLAPAGLDARALYPVYGLAEASLAVTFPEPGTGVQSVRLEPERLSVGSRVTPFADTDRGVELVYLGVPVDSCELRIHDGHGSVLPEYCVGHVQIRGDNVTSGYYPCPECGQAVWVDGWLDTGDLGLLGEGGLLITGRYKDVIFVNGQNWYPQDLERVVQQALALDAGRVAVAAARSRSNAEDLLLVFVQYRRDTDTFIETARRVQSAMAAHAGLHTHAVVPVRNLPRTTSGKLQRYRLVQSFESGDYRAVLNALDACLTESGAAGSADEVERQLIDLCSRVFPDTPVRIDQNLFELGADSLMLVKIHEGIDARFPGTVEITDLFDYPTITSLAGYIKNHGA